MTENLKPREKLFVEEYLKNNFDAEVAAKKAGYGGKEGRDMSRMLMRSPDVQAAIRTRLKEGQLTADQILRRVSEMALSNIADFLDDNGKVDINKLRSRGYLVKSRKLRTTYGKDGSATTECEITLYDAQAALISLGKHLGLFKEPKKEDEDPNRLGGANLHFQLPQGTTIDDLRKLIGHLDANKSATQEHAAETAPQAAG